MYEYRSPAYLSAHRLAGVNILLIVRGPAQRVGPLALLEIVHAALVRGHGSCGRRSGRRGHPGGGTFYKGNKEGNGEGNVAP